MNKVAILTTHRANNFGAMLQAFALVQKCREFGADAKILDWRHPFFEDQYYNPWRVKSRNPLPRIEYAWRWFVRESQSRRFFDEFRRRLPLSDKITAENELEEIETRYDSIIVGSDQIWNPSMTARDPRKFDRAYLLGFVAHAKKNAYAASIGHNSIEVEELLPEFKRAWQSFDNITMREVAGADFVGKILGRKIDVVVDPVMLHDAGFWRGIASHLVTPNEDYVLIYNVQHYRNESQWMISMAKDYACKHNCRLVDVFVPSARSRWTRDSVCAGPAEFVDLIDNANAVFTNSFHASAFSVIFGKTLFLHRSEAKGTTNSRFDTLLGESAERNKVAESDNGDVIIKFDLSMNAFCVNRKMVSSSILALSKMIGK